LFPESEFKVRRTRVRENLAELDVDALVVTALLNIRYLTGFTGSNGILLLTPSREILFTDPRYTVQSKRETSCRVRTVKGPTLAAVAKAINRLRLRKTGFEYHTIPFHIYTFLNQGLRPGGSLVPTRNLVETLRMIKSPVEIDAIRRAVETNSKAFSKVLPTIRPGLGERRIAADLEYQMRRLGGDGPAFDTIVASGSRAALPHARPTSKSVEANQLLLIDMGTIQDGYTSDMTRTIFLGRPTHKWKKSYQAVLQAQLAAIDAIRDGVPTASPDQKARKVLKSHGLDKAFTHSTGHGLGLEIHEEPRLGKRDRNKLRAGMVVTVEPGIYLEGGGGIRIEDTVLVTPTGCEILTPTGKELTVI